MDLTRASIKQYYLLSIEDKEKQEFLQNLFAEYKWQEDRQRMDLSEFNKTEILHMLGKRKNKYYYDEIKKVHLYLKEYTDFCINLRNVKSDNYYTMISDNELRMCAEPEIVQWINRDKLDYLISLLYNNRDKFICEAIYGGCGVNDISNLLHVSINDLDFNRGLMHLADRTITVNQNLLNYAKKANKELNILIAHKTGIVTKSVVQGPYIVKFPQLLKEDRDYKNKIIQIFFSYKKTTNGQFDLKGGITALYYDGAVQAVRDEAKALSISPVEFMEDPRLYSNIIKRYNIPDTIFALRHLRTRVKRCL